MTTTRRIGALTVSSIGFGAMPFSMGDNVKPSHEQAIATVHAALDAGITFIDTADIYAPPMGQMGHNELIIAEALRTWSGDASTVVVATKGGITRNETNDRNIRNGSPEYLRRALEASLERLQRDQIDLYYWHRPDRRRLYSEVVETFASFKEEGLVREVGISNANSEEIDIAVEVLGDGGLAAVQNEFSLRFNDTSQKELARCRDLGVAFIPWSPLGGTGGDAGTLHEKYPSVVRAAEARGVSPQQVVLAWILAQGEHVIPIPGASRPQTITDSAGAMHLTLTAEEVAAIDFEAL